MSSEFTKLIQSLKQDIHTVNQPGLCISPSDKPALLAPVNSTSVDKSEIGSVVHSSCETGSVSSWTKNKSLQFFVEKGMLSAEFFFFFVIFLSWLRPKCLYKTERKMRGNQQIVVQTFSFLYLFVYAMIFTGLMHLFIYLQKRCSRSFHR